MVALRVPLAIVVLLAACCLGLAQKGNAEVQKEIAQLQKLEKNYLAAKAGHTKAPKDAKKKKLYADASTDYGYAVMLTQTIAPRAKYPKALKLFRETLKVDPKHAKAKKWSTTIEDIYRSMGRPIPKV